MIIKWMWCRLEIRNYNYYYSQRMYTIDWPVLWGLDNFLIIPVITSIEIKQGTKWPFWNLNWIKNQNYCDILLNFLLHDGK